MCVEAEGKCCAGMRDEEQSGREDGQRKKLKWLKMFYNAFMII
jgi:hypothetical protein